MQYLLLFYIHIIIIVFIVVLFIHIIIIVFIVVLFIIIIIIIIIIVLAVFIIVVLFIHIIIIINSLADSKDADWLTLWSTVPGGFLRLFRKAFLFHKLLKVNDVL